MEYAILVLQMAFGAALFLGHGLGKLRDLPGTTKWFKSIGFGTLGGIWAALTEGIASLLLVLGVYPRVMAALIGITMIGAMMFHWKNRDAFKGGWETPLLFLIAMIAIVLSGYSPWGLIVG